MPNQFIFFCLVYVSIVSNCGAQTNNLFQYFAGTEGLYESIPYSGCTYDIGPEPPPDLYFSITKKRDTIIDTIPYSLFSFSDENDILELWVGAKDNCIYLNESDDFSAPAVICNGSNESPLLKQLGCYYNIMLTYDEHTVGTDPGDNYQEVTIELDLKLKESGKNIFRSKKLRRLMISSQHGLFISLESGGKYYTG